VTSNRTRMQTKCAPLNSTGQQHMCFLCQMRARQAPLLLLSQACHNLGNGRVAKEPACSNTRGMQTMCTPLNSTGQLQMCFLCQKKPR
jgi:hypothetical protein